MEDADIRQVLARNIRALAKKRRISLNRLADFAGTTRSQMFRVLRSETSPTLSWLTRVANALDVAPADLISTRGR